jgi:hypothetical protein
MQAEVFVRRLDVIPVQMANIWQWADVNNVNPENIRTIRMTSSVSLVLSANIKINLVKNLARIAPSASLNQTWAKQVARIVVNIIIKIWKVRTNAENVLVVGSAILSNCHAQRAFNVESAPCIAITRSMGIIVANPLQQFVRQVSKMLSPLKNHVTYVEKPPFSMLLLKNAKYVRSEEQRTVMVKKCVKIVKWVKNLQQVVYVNIVRPGDIKTRLKKQNANYVPLGKVRRPPVHIIRTTVHHVLLDDTPTKQVRPNVKIVRRAGGQRVGLKNATRARKKAITQTSVSNANAGNKNLSTEHPLGVKEVGRAT